MILNSPYITGSLTVTGNANIQGQLTVTGSLSGTAATASFALTLGGTGSIGFATTASLLEVSSSQQQISSSYISLSGSYNTFSGSASTRISNNESTGSVLTTASGSFSTRISNNETSSNNLTNASASFSSRTTQIEQVYATTGSNSFRATQSITGSLTVTGQIIAQTLNVQQVTSSIIYSSGSNDFGCDLNSRQTFTGSVLITGSLNTVGNTCVTSICSPSFVGGTMSGTTVYGSTVACSPVGCFATSCATSFLGGTVSGTTIYGSTAICGATVIGSSIVCSAASVYAATNIRLSSGTSAGNASDPAITTGGCTKTGIYFAGSCVALGSGGNSLLLAQNGNVGIGTVSPAGKLDINGGQYNTGLIIRTCSDNGAGLNLKNTDTGGHDWYVISTATSNGGGAGNLGFYDGTAGCYMVYFKGNGNVGIGTLSPAYTLDVSGTLGISGLFTSTAFGSNSFSGGGTGYNKLTIRNTTAGAANGAQLSIGTNADPDQFYVQSFATTFTTSGMNVAGGAVINGEGPGGLNLAATQANIGFYTNGATASNLRMTIICGGQVQIGCGVNSMFYNGSLCRYNFTALNTAQDLVGICANNGIIVIRDHTVGGTGAFLIDPNQGVICMASNIQATVAIAWNGLLWRWCLTSGSVPRCLGYGFYGA